MDYTRSPVVILPTVHSHLDINTQIRIILCSGFSMYSQDGHSYLPQLIFKLRTATFTLQTDPCGIGPAISLKKTASFLSDFNRLADKTARRPEYKTRERIHRGVLIRDY